MSPHTPSIPHALPSPLSVPRGVYHMSQRFFFDAAHTLERDIDAAGSRRMHGHTYHAEVTLSGQPDPATGMVLDLGHLRRLIDEIRDQLDHHLLDEVPGLGTPTLENLCAYIAARLAPCAAGLSAVRVWRESTGDGCLLQMA
ncbi:MAG: 6-carboxytetrahydropterin synthase QueD [Rhodoferax sp.]|nr:6-carboxytetrahydropterin synthase QueD [Rhodoferax sp.]